MHSWVPWASCSPCGTYGYGQECGWPLASCLLRWPYETGVDPFLVTSRQAREIVVRSLLDAVANLRDRNSRRKEEIDRAQIWLLVSSALAAVSLVTYQLA